MWTSGNGLLVAERVHLIQQHAVARRAGGDKVDGAPAVAEPRCMNMRRLPSPPRDTCWARILSPKVLASGHRRDRHTDGDGSV
jgi:hypothetical protein